MRDAVHVLCATADVADGDAWLGRRERALQQALARPQRRSAWRLGRWGAKAAAAAWLDVPAARIEILSAADGAPEVWLDGVRARASLSLSHRAGRGLALAGPPDCALGCDIELIEPRSHAFVREWLAPSERALVAAAPAGPARELVANLLWTAKEAAAKVRREGLRLDVRGAVVTLTPRTDGDWRGLEVRWPASPPTPGWWRTAGGCVMTLAGTPGDAAPAGGRCLPEPRHDG